MLKNFIAKLELIKQPRNPKWILPLTAICLGLFLIKPKSESAAPSAQSTRSSSADTYIPAGFVLVPILLVNQASIDPMFGKYTVVDLYLASESLENSRKLIARDVRMIRAPLDPNQFGVLMDESQQLVIEKLSQPIFAVVKNPKTNREMSTVKTSKGRISYGD